jgi:DDE superfamily endonuclease
MDDFKLLDLYTDYLISAFGLVTSTELSKLLDQAVSHDRISRMLSKREFTQKDYWHCIKKIIRRLESPRGIIKIDDTIEEKPHSTENDIICWNYDHTTGHTIKGINIINFVYQPHPSSESKFSLPVAFEIVEKTEPYFDVKTKKVKRRSKVGKNEIVRTRLRILCQLNKLQFQTVLWDSWYSSIENFEFVHRELKKTFIGAIKSNRKIALTAKDKLDGKFKKVSELEWQRNQTRIVYLQSMDFPVLLAKQVFINKDRSIGELFLVSNDLNLTFTELVETYGERWGVEVFHRSLKQNVGLEKSPTKYEVTQRNHIFAAMLAWIKLEILSFKNQSNHYGFKTKLYVKALKAAFDELQCIKQSVKTLAEPQEFVMPLLA